MDTMIMKMPAVALRGMVILPGMVAHFDVSRAKSIKAVEEAMMDEQKIFLVAQKDVEQENPDIEDLFKIGIIAEVKQVIKLQNNIVRILVEGKERAELSAFLENPDYLLAEIIRFDEEVDDGLPEEAKEAMLRSIQETFGKYVVVNPKMGKELQRQLSEITDLEKLIALPDNFCIFISILPRKKKFTSQFIKIMLKFIHFILKVLIFQTYKIQFLTAIPQTLNVT